MNERTIFRNKNPLPPKCVPTLDTLPLELIDVDLKLNARNALQTEVGENLETDARARDLLERGRHALGNRVDNVGAHGLAHIDLQDVADAKQQSVFIFLFLRLHTDPTNKQTIRNDKRTSM